MNFGTRPRQEQIRPLSLDQAVEAMSVEGWRVAGQGPGSAMMQRGWQAAQLREVPGGVAHARVTSRRTLIAWTGSVLLVLAVCAGSFGLSGTDEKPKRPATLSATAAASVAPSTSAPSPTESPTPEPTTAAPSPTPVRGPGYVVARTWVDEEYPGDDGASLVIKPANEATARKAIAHYIKNNSKGHKYLYVEALRSADATEWMCRGAYLTTAQQYEDGLYDPPAPKRYPATVIECRTEDAGGDDAGGGDVYYPNCAAVREAGADPIRRGDPGYGKHLDRDGDGVGCE